MYLPAVPAADAARDDLDDEPLPHGDGELILLVDDEPMVLEIASATLEANGYRVLFANSGPRAVAIYSQHVGRDSGRGRRHDDARHGRHRHDAGTQRHRSGRRV